ncbi:hypothetical protein [Haloarcula amylolytica]|uniref:hypothetical protein n=1 Tax=Haloarcula amylolytica TaxID=396317 RepID=UPI00126713E8|nr:hypothetical protein [Haloarcula amylolytica]
MSRSHPDADGLNEAEEIVRELRTAYTECVEANTYGVHVAVETVESGHERFRDLSTAFITAYRRNELRRTIEAEFQLRSAPLIA